MVKLNALALLAMISSCVAFSPPSFTPQRIRVLDSYERHISHRSPRRRKQSIQLNTSNERANSMKLNMVPASSATAAASVVGAITGGILGGALHAIAGPDHLAALLPRCCGQNWYKAGRIGALWGMGHGVSATLLGITAFGLKNRLSNMPGVKGLLIGASSAMEIAVGASLILIGLLGIKESREFGNDDEEEAATNSIVADEDGIKKAQKRAVVFNGILHGFSWDGAPSLAPAVAVATWRGSLSFLLAYAIGTMGAMSITTLLIGESTRRAGEILHRPDLPQKLSLVSSVIAMGVGFFWCYLAFIK
jgi:hypothetical protein